MSNKTKIKILNMNLLMVLIILILGAVFSVNIQAATSNSNNNIDNILENAGQGHESDPSYWTQDDLSEWWLFCCKHGTAAPQQRIEATNNESTVSGDTYGKYKTPFDKTATIYDRLSNSHVISLGDEAEDIEITDKNKGRLFYTPYTFVWAKYTNRTTYNTNPSESYILSVADQYTESTDNIPYHTAAQWAWWNTGLGGEGSIKGRNYDDLWTAASGFQTYVDKVIGVSSYEPPAEADGDKWATYTIEGNTFVAPNIDKYYQPTVSYYSKSSSSNAELIELTTDNSGDLSGQISDTADIQVFFESNDNTYYVGPFSISYYGEDIEITEDSEAIQEDIVNLTAIYDDLYGDGKLSSLTNLNLDNEDKLMALINDLTYILWVYDDNSGTLEGYYQDFSEYYYFIGEDGPKKAIEDEITGLATFISDHKTGIINAIKKQINVLKKEKNDDDETTTTVSFSGIESAYIKTNLDGSEGTSIEMRRISSRRSK